MSETKTAPRRAGTTTSRASRLGTERDRYRIGILLFLIAAFGSFVLSIGLWFAGNREEGAFVGLWVPSILAAGAFWVAAVRTR